MGIALLTLCLVVACSQPLSADEVAVTGEPLLVDDELARRATWSQADLEGVRGQMELWIAEQQQLGALDADVAQRAIAAWQTSFDAASGDVSERILETWALVDPRASELFELIQRPDATTALADTTVLDDKEIPALMRNSARLAYGVWLTNVRLYDEALEQFNRLQVDDVADPARLLFYQGATHYRLLSIQAGIDTLGRLLEREDEIPLRFVTLAELMRSELESIQKDSLDEIAKLMDSIQVRLDHGRAGKRVRTEEDEVVAKLDKMIEELEKQRQQQQQQQNSGQSSGKQPTMPMQDSRLAEASGAGNVDAKTMDGPIDWGNLPPKERQEALQELGKLYPSHYREVIEEYFRDLARREVDSP